MDRRPIRVSVSVDGHPTPSQTRDGMAVVAGQCPPAFLVTFQMLHGYQAGGNKVWRPHVL